MSCYTNAASVELFINGESLGKKIVLHAYTRTGLSAQYKLTQA